ncbi:MAG: hypothetical protein P4L45_02990 [Ignavibacteriaceae bacterium]|nr:hypothetical protein [Ignavibacteriaceae bacterium]
MKRNFVLAIGFISILFSLNACKNNSTNPGDSNTNTGSPTTYFPNNDGTSYKYSVVKTDSAQYQTSVTRTAYYSGTTVSGSITYQKEIDSVGSLGLANVSTSLFVKDNNGVYFHVDTTGLYKVIPAAYKDYISIDQSIEILKTSFQDGNSWAAFSLGLKYSTLSLTIAKVDAVFKGIEQVTLGLTTGTVTLSAAKIQYTLTLSIPDPNNLFATPSKSTFTANAWFADKIGIVKIDGNATILDTFTGNGINFADTTSTATQSLIKYNIK